MKYFMITIFLFALLVACREQVQTNKPAPIQLTKEATGHYCQMTVLEHSGPKGQIFLDGNPQPFWFTQVRDAIAFTISPEESNNIAAIYVNDMNVAESWENTGDLNWIDATEAWFVIESNLTGGMGAPEAIPFGNMDGAELFVEENGGKIVPLDEVPADYVLSSFEPIHSIEAETN